MMPTGFPVPSFSHLRRLTDHGGLYEHAELADPRRDHGYCLDDVARALIAVGRELDPSGRPDPLVAPYLDFVLEAQAADGRFRNRRSCDLTWHGEAVVEDCWGRGVWALGATVSSRVPAHLRDRALAAFDRSAPLRSPWSRAMAFAGLGAAEVLGVRPDHSAARALLLAAVSRIGPAAADPGWPWPEARLSYANAVVPEVLIAAGAILDDGAVLAHGLHLLGWLLEVESHDGHLSVTPVGGRGPGDPLGPGFDQQPIEVAALADACARALEVTGDRRWADGVELAAGWFFGANDAGITLFDPLTGGGCDGLEPYGRNENQGAESTLALITTLQQVQLLTVGVQ